MYESENPVRAKADILVDIECLVKRPGFVYTFAYMVYKFIWISPEDIANVDWNERLNTQELAFILGVLVKFPLEIDHVPTSDELQEQISAADLLMNEFHEAHSIISLLKKPFNNEDSDENDYIQRLLNEWSKNSDQFVEPIFYGSRGTYDFRYLELARTKYANDGNWIETSIGLSVDSMISIANELRDLIYSSMQVLHESDMNMGKCSAVLAAFSFSPDDISCIDKATVRRFLDQFSVRPGENNKGFGTLGSLNVVHSRPIVQLSNTRYIVPIWFLLSESIYESPFYWMNNDDGYIHRASKNRGEYNESIVYEMVATVFGRKHVRRNVFIKQGKQTVGEIDVLATYGNKAIVFQIKSKKLTLDARSGDLLALEKDFRNAVQTAFNQGRRSREMLSTRNGIFVDGYGRVVALPKEINEVYIVCVAGDDYPAIASQLKDYLKKQSDDPYPVVMNVFELDFVSFYLDDPIDFIYYLKRRITSLEYVAPEIENAYVGLFLENRLAHLEPVEMVRALVKYRQRLDANFYELRAPNSSKSVNSKIACSWKHPRVSKLVDRMKEIDPERFLDQIYFLYDWVSVDSQTIMAIYDETRDRALNENRIIMNSIPLSSGLRGITIIGYPDKSSFDLQEFEAICTESRRNRNGDEWIGFATFAGAANVFVALWYQR